MKKQGLQYLKILLTKYFLLHEELPEVIWIAEKLEMTVEKVESYIAYLEKKNFIIDDKIADEYIDQYQQKRESKLQEKYNQIEPKEKPIGAKPSKEKIHIPNKTILVFKIALALIGSGATYMSILYSTEWLLSFLSPFNATLLALIMVVYAVGSFELIILLYKKYLWMSVIFGILWILVTGFSMMSTVAGQYTKRVEEIQSQYSDKVEKTQSDNELTTWSDKKAKYENDLDKLDKEYNRIQTILAGFDLNKTESNYKLYRNLNWQLHVIKKDRKKLSESYIIHIDSKPEEIVEKEEVNFYKWLSNIFKVKADALQFWLSLFPAIFIDLIAPFSFAVVMFYKGE